MKHAATTLILAVLMALSLIGCAIAAPSETNTPDISEETPATNTTEMDSGRLSITKLYGDTQYRQDIDALSLLCVEGHAFLFGTQASSHGYTANSSLARLPEKDDQCASTKNTDTSN